MEKTYLKTAALISNSFKAVPLILNKGKEE